MKPEYAVWIERYVRAYDDKIAGRCYGAAHQMQKDFPELTICRGYVKELGAHWWCKTAEGDVIDPTASQFHGPRMVNAGVMILEYEEFSVEKHGPEPIGKCMNCGDLCYKDTSPNSNVCSEACEKELVVYYGRHPGRLVT